MSQKQMEHLVKQNALKLDKKSGLHEHMGKYVVFDGENILFSESFQDALKQGDKTFGSASGFVVRKVGHIPTLSYLIKP